MRWLREPLVQFLLIGAVLFIVFDLRGGDARGGQRIVITPGQVDAVAAGFSRTWNRPPDEQELKAQVDEYVREEIAVREAQALGLDRDDTVSTPTRSEQALSLRCPRDTSGPSFHGAKLGVIPRRAEPASIPRPKPSWRPPTAKASASATTTPPSRIRTFCWMSPSSISRWSPPTHDEGDHAVLHEAAEQLPVADLSPRSSRAPHCRQSAQRSCRNTNTA